MKCFKMLGLATLAIAVTAATIGGTAAASEPKIEPEGGTFPVNFSGSGGTSVLGTTSEGGKVRTVQCSANSFSGEIYSFTTLWNIVFKFTGCTASGPFGTNWACVSTGASSGEVRTVSLTGTLVYLSAGSNAAGMLFSPEAGATVMSFTCKGFFLWETLTVTGAAIGKLSPVNSLTGTFTLTFGQTGGHQVPETYLATIGCAATKAVLSTSGSGAESFGPIQSGISGTDNLTFSPRIKVASSSCA